MCRGDFSQKTIDTIFFTNKKSVETSLEKKVINKSCSFFRVILGDF